MFGRPRRLALLAEGRSMPSDARAVGSVPCYRFEEVAAVIGSTWPGRMVAGCGGVLEAVRGAGLVAFRRNHAPAA